MKFDSNCKAIIESMNLLELDGYIDCCRDEIDRHIKEKFAVLQHNKKIRRMLNGEMNDYYKAVLRFWQSAMWRHRQDIQGTRECILRAEDRMEMLEFLA